MNSPSRGFRSRLLVLDGGAVGSNFFGLLRVAFHVKLGEKGQERKDVAGVNRHDTWRVALAPEADLEVGVKGEGGGSYTTSENSSNSARAS